MLEQRERMFDYAKEQGSEWMLKKSSADVCQREEETRRIAS